MDLALILPRIIHRVIRISIQKLISSYRRITKWYHVEFMSVESYAISDLSTYGSYIATDILLSPHISKEELYPEIR